MLDINTRRVEDRILNLSQPWIRLNVRGKSKAPTELGAKIPISVVNRYTFIDRFTFDAYNEREASEYERVIEMFYGQSWKDVPIEEFITILDEYIHWYSEKRNKLFPRGMSSLQYRRCLGFIAA